MDDYESTTLSFVIRVWIEETANESSQVKWRGHITHVPSHERRYVANMADISAFIETYLAQIGVQPAGP